MPVQFAERSEFTTAPAEVFAILTDPAFLAARAVRSKALAHTESVTLEGQGQDQVTIVATTRTVSTEVLPPAAGRFLGSTAVVEQVERWEPASADGLRRARLVLTIGSAPVELSAATTLAPHGAGSVHTLEGSLTVRVPLLGGSIEKAALPGLLQLIRSETELAREWSPS